MDENVILIKTEDMENRTAATLEVDVHAEQYEVKTDIQEFDSSSNDRMTMDEIVVGNITSDEADAVEISVEEAVGWAGGDNTIHDNLAGRDAPYQHPITSITGLRTELDQIEALQTVYSDKKHQADYYLWRQDDNNHLPSHPYGLFVSISPNTEEIQICNGETDVFGVTVSEAAFVGNQIDIKAKGGTKTGRDGSYGLVVNAGLVGVRHTSEVLVGDYVVPNMRGEAKKSDGNYGYLVTSFSEDDSVSYAMISLSAPSTWSKSTAERVEDLSSRMSTAEYNIASVGNVANSAYVIAKDAQEKAEVSAEYIEQEVEKVLGRMDDVDGIIGNLSESVNNASANAAMARAIADGAVSSAEAMRGEAVAKANEALAEASNARKEVEAKINEINTELENTSLELQATKESFESTINDLRLDTEGQLADFNKEVSDNYATTTQLAAVKTETSEAIAAVKQEASDTYATQEMLTAYETEASQALAGFKQEVTETYATQEMLTVYKNDTSDALAAYKTEVAENYATQEMVSSLEADTKKALTDYKQEVTDTYATQEMVSALETETSKALTDYKQEVEDNYATQEMLTNLETDTTKALTDYKQEVTDTYATQEMLTAFEGSTNTSIANIKQQADENGAKIEAFVSNIDKYAVGEYSQAYGLTLKQAKEILPVGTVYVPTILHIEKYAGYIDGDGNVYDDYMRGFALGYYYTWDGTEWDASQSTAVSFSSTYFAGTTTTPYWVVTVANVTKDGITYELGGLYHWEQVNEILQWVKVASIASNALSRAMSAIKVTNDSIETSVTAIDNKYAGTKTWIDSNKANIQDTVQWHSVNGDSLVTFMQEAGDNFASASQVAKIVDKDGNINEASIVAVVNDNASSIYLSADNINFEGSQFSSKMSQTYSTKDEVSESINNIEVGGRNLILNSKQAVSSDQYLTKEYQLSEDWKLNTTYTITIKGSINDGQKFGIWANGYMTRVATLTYNETTGLHTATFIPEQIVASKEKALLVYNTPSGTATESSIEWIKLEKGNKITDWTPAPEDTDEKLKDYATTTELQSAIDQTAESISLVVTEQNGEKVVNTAKISAAIANDESSIQLIADKVSVDGYVTFTALETEGETTIHGGNIKTNTLSAITSNLGAVTSGQIQSPDYMRPVIWGSNSTSTSAVMTLALDENEPGTSTYSLEEGASAFAMDEGVSVAATEQTPSEGLKYGSLGDNAYKVIGMGTCEDTDVVIPSTYNGKPVASIGDFAFEDCDDLTSVVIPDSVTSIEDDAFSGCTSLTSITIPDSVTRIGYCAFYNCNSLTYSIKDGLKYLGNSNNPYVGLIRPKSWNITRATISNNCKTIADCAFESCSSLKSVVIPDSVTSIGVDAFECPSILTDVYYGGTSSQWISLRKNIGSGNDNLLSATLHYFDSSGLSYELNSDGNGYIVTGIGSCTDTDIVIPSTYIQLPVTSIGDSAFDGCRSLTSITIPDSVTSIGWGAFSGCTSLTSVEIGDSVTSIGDYAFQFCSSLTSVVIGGSVTSIGGSAFSNCSSLTNVYYKGTAVAWGTKISIGSNNGPLINAMRYYYSETKPTDSGNYWHYGGGFKISCDDENMIESKYFKVTQDGAISATNANIEGHVEATSGVIGPYSLSEAGLEAPGLRMQGNKITLLPISPDGGEDVGSISLQGKAALYANDSGLFIENLGDKDLYIRNKSGAGIKFLGETKNEIIWKSMTIEVSRGTAYISTNADGAKTVATIMVTITKDETTSGGILSVSCNRDLTSNVPIIYSAAAMYRETSTYYTRIGWSHESIWNQYDIEVAVELDDGQRMWTILTGNGASDTKSFLLEANSGTNNILYSLGSFNPEQSNQCFLGNDDHVWKALRVETSPQVGSDRNLKNNIMGLSEDYDFFFNNLNPVSFRYNNGDSGRTHIGFIAQEVETSLNNAGLTTKDFAGVCIGQDDSRTYSLRYEEFIALNTYQIQKLKKQVELLTDEVNTLKAQQND